MAETLAQQNTTAGKNARCKTPLLAIKLVVLFRET